MGKRVLVTGGAGFIGSHLCAALCARGDEVLCLDNFDPFYPERLKRRAIAELLAQGMRLVEADVRDEPAVRRAAGELRPDAVVHLAARAGVRPSLADPAGYVDVNARGTAAVLAAARNAQVPRFLLGSSSSVYGASAAPPFREDARVDAPQSPYAASKAAAELLARSFHQLYGTQTAVLRLFTVYGPRQRPDLAIHGFARRMLAGAPLPFFGDGSSARDYTYVDDIVRGLLAALDAPLAFEVLNLGGARTTSLRELVALLEESLGVKAVLDPRPAQPGDMHLTSADLGRARAVLGYAPQVPLREGLRRFAEWLRGEGRDWI